MRQEKSHKKGMSIPLNKNNQRKAGDKILRICLSEELLNRNLRLLDSENYSMVVLTVNFLSVILYFVYYQKFTPNWQCP